MTIAEILLIVWLHFIGDFIFQSDEVAKRKSSENKVLFIHVVYYMVPFVIFGVVFWLVNFVFHFLTDYVSSRLTSRLYQAGERHWFFVVIGADQALHMTALFLSYVWLDAIGWSGLGVYLK